MALFELQAGISLVVFFLIFIVEAFAFIDAVTRPAQAYVADFPMTSSGKIQKTLLRERAAADLSPRP